MLNNDIARYRYLMAAMEIVCEVFRDRELFQHDEVFQFINFVVTDKIYSKCLHLRRIFRTYKFYLISDKMFEDANFFVSLIDRLVLKEPPVFTSIFIDKWQLTKKEADHAE